MFPLKQKFDVTGMTCSACSLPHRTCRPAGTPFSLSARRK
ncbi:hypothetical protein BACCAP_00887 [Pseudoflavonifractor capillosus ATCC 29799]|uniref:Uncharacterized protein n=1 Tax=Pseudoflavonifractor capillosus ATCC 29799 TaxID=411467 RepID=A6NRQ9_9FIRM|nr:hypothetical protein BACCAP_00887 [Pseudoflavonifractor capillosus ATCC 29799]